MQDDGGRSDKSGGIFSSEPAMPLLLIYDLEERPLGGPLDLIALHGRLGVSEGLDNGLAAKVMPAITDHFSFVLAPGSRGSLPLTFSQDPSPLAPDVALGDVETFQDLSAEVQCENRPHAHTLHQLCVDR